MDREGARSLKYDREQKIRLIDRTTLAKSPGLYIQ